MLAFPHLRLRQFSLFLTCEGRKHFFEDFQASGNTMFWSVIVARKCPVLVTNQYFCSCKRRIDPPKKISALFNGVIGL